MILKIKRYVTGRDWWIIDNIAKINYGIEKITENMVAEESDVAINDYRRNQQTTFDSKLSLARAVCRMKDGEEVSVEFDTMAYLCNDEGKTIEKIVANYNVSEPCANPLTD